MNDLFNPLTLNRLSVMLDLIKIIFQNMVYEVYKKKILIRMLLRFHNHQM